MPTETLIDIGANLTHDSFDVDRDEVIQTAIDVGVKHMIVTGATVDGSVQAAKLAKQWPKVLYSTAGVHPHHARDWSSTSPKILGELINQPQVVAAGECGLDYFRNFSTPQQQKIAFEAQLQLAVDWQLPVFLHQREACDPFLEILDPFLDKIPRAVAHCFTDHRKELDKLLARDLYIGITGWICDERRGHHLRELVSRIPQNRLMIETDAPYLLPRDLDPKPKSRRNLPQYLPHINSSVAHCLSMPPKQLALQTTRTAMEFFNLPITN